MNKKGILMDVPENVMLVFFVAVLLFLAYFIIANINTEIQSEAAFSGSAATFFDDFSTRTPKAFDGAIAIVFFGMMTVLVGISWVLATNGVMFFIVWMVTVISMAFAGFLSNAWVTMTSTDALSAAVLNMPITNFIMEWYLILTIVQAFLMLSVFFAKRQSGGAE